MAKLFGKKKEDKDKNKKSLFRTEKTESRSVPGYAEELNRINARIRISEERYSSLRKRVQFVEQNMLSYHKKTVKDIKTLNSEISEIKHQISEIKQRIILIIKELELSAGKEDVDVLKKYMEYWEPIKFVTVKQVEKIINQKLHKAGITPTRKEETQTKSKEEKEK